MSGGYFDYKELDLMYQIFGYNTYYRNDKVKNVFEDQEISGIVLDLLSLIHIYDLYKSGDIGEETWLADKEKFKVKWIVDGNEQLKQIRKATKAIHKVLNNIYKFGE